MRRIAIIAALSLLAAAIPGLTLAVEGDDPPREFRAYWVDAFGAGIYTPAEIDTLVAATKAANMNALVVQVGRRGDCFCNRAIMPRTQANIALLPYDPLDTLIEKAHAEGIEVHAWVIATAIWGRTAPPPTAANHVYNTHGPSITGYDNWIMTRYDGPGVGDFYIDPGHPDAADYIVSMFTSIVENYDVDGINFDRIRYPDGQLAAWSAYSAWGYNQVALDRFHAATGRSDRPLPDDAEWGQWRRDQVTNIVRRVYLESYAINPDVVISADTITYGDGPDQLGGWELSRPYRETLQDWRAWMEEGILDLNIPMNYKREFCVVGNEAAGCFGFPQQAWYDNWNEFSKDNQYGRQAAIGSALYLNYVPDSVVQVREALAPSTAGNDAIGWVGYSYRTPDCLANPPNYCGFTGDSGRTGTASRAELTIALTEPSAFDPIEPPVFAEPAVVPGQAWKDNPTTGHVLGHVVDPAAGPVDQVTVELLDAETDAFIAAMVSDGSGTFGFVDLQPGRYKVVVDGERVLGRRVVAFSVAAGEVTGVVVPVRER